MRGKRIRFVRWVFAITILGVGIILLMIGILPRSNGGIYKIQFSGLEYSMMGFVLFTGSLFILFSLLIAISLAAILFLRPATRKKTKPRLFKSLP